ncbi:MAG: lipocalin family protein [Bdellovibrionales bacterium]|nr:lipocalin family protein [Bdellovibrionales bacterium]
MKFLGTAFGFSLLTFSAWASAHDFAELKTVPSVDLNRYTGVWHQIAFFPTRFQRKCTLDTTAEYGLRADGKISVRNECTKNESGKRVSIEGTARVVDPVSLAKLKVKFFWFAPAGDYWIIDLGSNYEYAVVGTPDRDYLWVLSRTPTISQNVYDQLVARAKAQQFPVEKLQITGKVQ